MKKLDALDEAIRAVLKETRDPKSRLYLRRALNNERPRKRPKQRKAHAR